MAAAPLRFAPSGDDAGPMRLFASKSFADETVGLPMVSSAKLLEAKPPEPRGAVKAREPSRRAN